MSARLVVLLLWCLIMALEGTSVTAQLHPASSGGVLAANTPVAIAMVCPSGFELSQVVAALMTTDGSQFSWSSGASLPLAADGSPVTSQAYIGTPTGSYYIRYTCHSSSSYCAVQFTFGFYCKSQASK